MNVNLSEYMQPDGFYDIDAILVKFDGYQADDIVFIEDDWDLSWFSPETQLAETHNRQKRKNKD